MKGQIRTGQFSTGQVWTVQVMRGKVRTDQVMTTMKMFSISKILEIERCLECVWLVSGGLLKGVQNVSEGCGFLSYIYWVS